MGPLGWVAVFAAALVGQWVWASEFPFFGYSPQLLLVAPVALAARRGALAAMSAGFVGGLLGNVGSRRLFGIDALAFVWIAYGVWALSKNVDTSRLMPQCALTIFMSWAYAALAIVAGLAFAGAPQWPGWAGCFVVPFYNALAAAILFEILERVEGRRGLR